MSQSDKLTFLTGLFVTGMIAANFLGGKLMAIGPIAISVGTPLMAITFLCTDIMSDVWGKKTAQNAVKLGLVANLVVLVYTQFAVRVGAPEYWTDQESYAIIFGSQWRLVLASLTSYLVSQLVDVNLFVTIKQRTGQSKLWLRNNLSTMTSQALDTVIFTTLAFGGTMPVEALIGMMIGQYGLRVLMALIDTPFCYLGVAWARRKN